MLSTSMNGTYMEVNVTALLTSSYRSETSLKPGGAGRIAKRAECLFLNKREFENPQYSQRCSCVTNVSIYSDLPFFRIMLNSLKRVCWDDDYHSCVSYSARFPANVWDRSQPGGIRTHWGNQTCLTRCWVKSSPQPAGPCYRVFILAIKTINADGSRVSFNKEIKSFNW